MSASFSEGAPSEDFTFASLLADTIATVLAAELVLLPCRPKVNANESITIIQAVLAAIQIAILGLRVHGASVALPIAMKGRERGIWFGRDAVDI